MTTPLIVVHPTSEVLVHSVAHRLINSLADAQATRGTASLVLTGGRIAARVYETLAQSPARDSVDWSRVDFWWGDERFVPTGDEDRNELAARETLLNALPVDPIRVHPVPGLGAFPRPEEAAEHYATELKRIGEGAWPVFDVVLLGVGEDAHVASLFPYHPGLEVEEPAVIGVHDSPKPPDQRVSMSLGLINAAREVWLVASGPGKAEAVSMAHSGVTKEQAPAAGVSGTHATRWLLDVAAASGLTST